MGEMWSCAAGSVGERWKNRFPGIMSDCTGRSSPMISNWVGKVTWGINGVTGGGVAYGYSLPVGHRFNVDFTLGIGYLGGSYKEYIPLDGHYVWQTTKNRRWFGPTKAGISLVWLIGRGNYSRKKGRQAVIRIRFSLVFIFLWIGLTACEHKDLCYDHPHFATVRVIFDWTKISNHDKPEGMRVVFIRPMMNLGKWSFPRE